MISATGGTISHLHEVTLTANAWNNAALPMHNKHKYIYKLLLFNINERSKTTASMSSLDEDLSCSLLGLQGFVLLTFLAMRACRDVPLMVPPSTRRGPGPHCGASDPGRAFARAGFVASLRP